MKFISVIVILILLIVNGCSKATPTEVKNTPEFVFNGIQCSFQIFTSINLQSGDTAVATVMKYGVNGYFRIKYGMISKQIVSFNSFVDTLYDNAVSSRPDPVNPPVPQISYTVPNILGGLDSVKVVAKIYGSFYNDETMQNSIGDFYKQDSCYVRITRMQFVSP
jgi:hypothetical protein